MYRTISDECMHIYIFLVLFVLREFHHDMMEIQILSSFDFFLFWGIA